MQCENKSKYQHGVIFVQPLNLVVNTYFAHTLLQVIAFIHTIWIPEIKPTTVTGKKPNVVNKQDDFTGGNRGTTCT